MSQIRLFVWSERLLRADVCVVVFYNHSFQNISFNDIFIVHLFSNPSSEHAAFISTGGIGLDCHLLMYKDI